MSSRSSISCTWTSALRTIASSARAVVAASLAIWPPCSMRAHPYTAFSGVRSSCDSTPMNSSFARSAVSAISRARRSLTSSASRSASPADSAAAAAARARAHLADLLDARLGRRRRLAPAEGLRGGAQRGHRAVDAARDRERNGAAERDRQQHAAAVDGERAERGHVGGAGGDAEDRRPAGRGQPAVRGEDALALERVRQAAALGAPALRHQPLRRLPRAGRPGSPRAPASARRAARRRPRRDHPVGGNALARDQRAHLLRLDERRHHVADVRTGGDDGHAHGELPLALRAAGEAAHHRRARAHGPLEAPRLGQRRQRGARRDARVDERPAGAVREGDAGPVRPAARARARRGGGSPRGRRGRAWAWWRAPRPPRASCAGPRRRRSRPSGRARCPPARPPPAAGARARRARCRPAPPAAGWPPRSARAGVARSGIAGMGVKATWAEQRAPVGGARFGDTSGHRGRRRSYSVPLRSARRSGCNLCNLPSSGGARESRKSFHISIMEAPQDPGMPPA